MNIWFHFFAVWKTALYFGLEKLMSECKSWFSDILERRVSSSQLQFDDLIHVWDFGYEQGKTSSSNFQIYVTEFGNDL